MIHCYAFVFYLFVVNSKQSSKCFSFPQETEEIDCWVFYGTNEGVCTVYLNSNALQFCFHWSALYVTYLQW